ncbi:MFS transporter [Flavobacterium plurextorum]|uniref:Alpha-ketoglutarate transporter n=2 Tax=Flavobacterium plurextorum TaxID=1114867 RepID=A0ABX4CQT6_9FLAO|nr:MULTISPECIES: MFS transporter [Flavobacterium]OXB04183.1 alpha-ketoglutarate transporter [Flavobacterium plurextorum]PIF60419.1 MHS family alpha-ketoglutarate permease-like MFS transporter [Flavobacterium sp. 2]UUW10803.1 MFS transporter [Flavobacterium plurextorum]
MSKKINVVSDQMTTSRRLKAIMSGSIGNLVEWYDWYAYSAFSIYFAPVFFPQSDSTVQLLNTAGIFAVGFLMRPIGGWLFGSLADRVGRKFSMTLSVLLMSLGSLLIALTPSYESIGVLAPILLLIARLLQGLSVGGEYGTSATYLSEMATAKHRGFFSSFQYVTLIGGQLIALGIQLVMQKLFLTEDQMHEWGWRVPFFIGAVLSLVALYLRSHMEETNEFKIIKNTNEETVKKKSGSLRELMRHKKSLGIVVGLTLGGTIAFYTYSTYMQKFLVNTVHLSKDDSTLVTFLSLLIFALIQPVFGLLSDKIGRKPLLLAFGILGTLATYPLLSAVSGASEKWEAFGYIMIALIIVSGYTSINAVVKAELFPTEIRALGVGFPYSVTVAIFGGTAEYIALWFKNVGHETYFYWYVTGCIFISLIVYSFMKDTRKTSTFGDTND